MTIRAGVALEDNVGAPVDGQAIVLKYGKYPSICKP